MVVSIFSVLAESTTEKRTSLTELIKGWVYVCDPKHLIIVLNAFYQ